MPLGFFIEFGVTFLMCERNNEENETKFENLFSPLLFLLPELDMFLTKLRTTFNGRHHLHPVHLLRLQGSSRLRSIAKLQRAQYTSSTVEEI